MGPALEPNQGIDGNASSGLMHDEIVSAALTLPNPGALTGEALRAAALEDGAH
jgi:hypothetical protein